MWLVENFLGRHATGYGIEKDQTVIHLRAKWVISTSEMHAGRRWAVD